MRLNYALKFMLVLFCVITTFLVIITGVVNWILDKDDVITMWEMLRFLLISFAGVLPTLIFVRGETKKPPSRVEAIILPTLHFFLTAGIVFGLMVYFRLIDATNAVIFIIFFITLYISVYIFQVLRDRTLAEQLNKRINAFHNTENATRRDEP